MRVIVSAWVASEPVAVLARKRRSHLNRAKDNGFMTTACVMPLSSMTGLCIHPSSTALLFNPIAWRAHISPAFRAASTDHAGQASATPDITCRNAAGCTLFATYGV